MRNNLKLNVPVWTWLTLFTFLPKEKTAMLVASNHPHHIIIKSNKVMLLLMAN